MRYPTLLPLLVVLVVVAVPTTHAALSLINRPAYGNIFRSAGAVFDLPPGSFTMEFWAKMYTPPRDVYLVSVCKPGCCNNNIVFGAFDTDGICYLIMGTSPYFEVEVANCGGDSLWHHYAFVVDATTDLAEFWLDGVRVAGPDPVTGIQRTGNVLVLGNDQDGASCTVDDASQAVSALMDEFRVWSAALSGDDIAAVMAGPVSPNSPNLSTYFVFNETYISPTTLTQALPGGISLSAGSEPPTYTAASPHTSIVFERAPPQHPILPSPPVVDIVSSAIHSCYAADLDADGVLDMVFSQDTAVVTAEPTVFVARGTGGLTFDTPSTVVTSTSIAAVAASDISTDGKPDLVVMHAGSSYPLVYLSTSSGPGDVSFALAPYEAGTGRALSQPVDNFALVPDQNGDGVTDAVYISAIRRELGWVTYGSGSPVSAPIISIPSGSLKFGFRSDDVYTDPLFVDTNGDALLDLIYMVVPAGTIGVVRALPRTAPAASVTFGVPFDLVDGVTHFTLADVDGDAQLELLTTISRTWAVWRFNGDSTVTQIASINIGTGQPPFGIMFADLDNNGLLDMVSNFDVESTELLVALQLAPLNFALGEAFGTSGSSKSRCVVFGQWESDGWPQLIMAPVATSSISLSGEIRAMHTGPVPRYLDPAIQLAPVGFSWCGSGQVPELLIVDANHDLVLDLVLSCNVDATTFAIYGDGDGGFMPAAQRTNPPSLAQLVATIAVDGDGDGMVDIVTLSSDSLVALSPFVDLSTAPAPAIPTPTIFTVATAGTPQWMAAADPNADGNVDLLVGGTLGIAVVVNNGPSASPFSAPAVLLASGAPSLRLHTVHDFSGSGAASDLAWVSATANTVYVSLANPGAPSYDQLYAAATAHLLAADPVVLIGGMYDGGDVADVLVGLDNGDVVVLADGGSGGPTTVLSGLGSILAVHLDPLVGHDGMLLVTTATGFVFFSDYGQYSFVPPGMPVGAKVVAADLFGNEATDLVVASSTDIAVAGGKMVLGAAPRREPANLAECGGVANSWLCISARAAHSADGATVTVGEVVPDSSSLCARAPAAHDYHRISRNITLAGGRIDCGPLGGVLLQVAAGAQLTIDGMQLISQASAATPVASLLAGAAFDVSSGGSLVVTSSTMSGFVADEGASARATVTLYGGAIRCAGSLTVTNATFAACQAGQFGGAIAMLGGAAATLTDVTFVDNTVTGEARTRTSGGGAVGGFEVASLTCTRCVFERNAAAGLGSGGGAVALRSLTLSSVVLVDCTFVDNSAPGGYGGAVFVDVSSTSASVAIANTSFSGSSAVFGGTVAAATLGSLSTSFAGFQAPNLPPPASLAALTALSATLRIESSTVSTSFARYGSVALSCGMVVDMSGTDLSSASLSYSQAGGVWYQCLPLTSTTAVVTTSLPTSSPSASSALAYGPIFASPAATLTWSRAGSALSVPSGVNFGIDGGQLLVTDGFGTPVSDTILDLLLSVSAPEALVTDAAIRWDVAAGGFSLKDVAIQIAGSHWPAEVGKEFSLKVSLRSGTYLELPVTVGACPVGFGAVTSNPLLPLSCSRCVAGTESTEESVAACTVVPTCAGTGYPVNGECVVCPANAVRLASQNTTSSGSAPPCVCARGYWNAGNEADRECTACPRGAICPGGTGVGSGPVARPGFFKVDVGKYEACKVDEACLGGSICAPEYKQGSMLCKDCSTGAYRQQDGSCKRCPNAPASLLALLGGAVIFAAMAAVVVGGLAAKQFQKRVDSDGEVGGVKRAPHTLSLAVIFLQVLGILAKAPLKWPKPPVKQILEAANVANVDLSFFAIDCSLPSFVVRYSISMLLPLLFGGVFLAILVLVKHVPALRCCFFRGVDASRVRVVDISLWAIFTFGPLVYIPLSRAALVFFDCTQYPDGKWYLDAEPSLQCFVGKWLATLELAIMGVGLYVVALPILFAAVLYKYRHSLRSPLVTLRYGSLYAVFRQHYYYAGMPVMFKRLLIIILFSGLLVVFVTSMLLLTKYSPYTYHPLNVIETKLDLSIVALLVAGLLFWMDEFPNDGTYAVFVVLVLGVIGYAAATLVVGLIRELRHHRASARQVGINGGNDENNEHNTMFLAWVRKFAPELSGSVRAAVRDLLGSDSGGADYDGSSGGSVEMVELGGATAKSDVSSHSLAAASNKAGERLESSSSSSVVSAESSTPASSASRSMSRASFRAARSAQLARNSEQTSTLRGVKSAAGAGSSFRASARGRR
ncbi:uncharacterized protein AMSG_01945 [Thecamonas trahens ATCC 50062]|uniref:Tyrosine-protein kinase ephrin type A/B receptor-like domain-containing protein n=1 Tax=Thecamonas trahens ATCC 50062 TaxID=461836 RepID=A0A0L0DTU6_THETB|nr:hypothetical protein AMSG_01945 [Thecamonas trahens ATCC 50062]KNC55675.1 hypothetical protein AMSG_01945 [Thecamonas trahens ATCC 50062]|eukprot:XP_013761443.1 hypothetical protein AMSG_01945 [Thecamonas trahens ATCC 50062]